MKRLAFLRSIYDGGRLCISPICALYLASKGVELHHLSLIKSVQAVIFLFLDIPIGIFISKVGNYLSSTVSLFLAICGFLLFVLGTELPHFFLAESLYALSLLIWPVAIDAYAIESLDMEGKENKISHYIHLSFCFSSILTICSVFLGGFLYPYYSALPYLIGIFIFIIGLFLLFQIRNFRSHPSSLPYSHSMKALLEQFLMLVKNNFFSLLFLFGIQYLIQPFLHYWQLFLVEKTSSIKPMHLCYFLLITSTINFLFSYLFSRVQSKSIILSKYTPVIVVFLGFILMSFSYFFNYSAALLVVISVMQSSLLISQNVVSVQINTKLKDRNRAILLKFTNFVSRLGMLLSLEVIYMICNKGVAQGGLVSYLFLIYYYKILFFVLFVLLVVFVKEFKFGAIKNES